MIYDITSREWGIKVIIHLTIHKLFHDVFEVASLLKILLHFALNGAELDVCIEV